LSEGDRSAIALAFFLTKLDHAIEDSSSPATRPTLVFDDPVSSFDSHRRDVTIEIIRDLLFNDAILQAIVLSHDAHILNDLLISVNKKQENDAIKTVTTAEFEIKINDIEKTSSLV
jgi:wobble nucleotide-excising tRNase